MSSDERSTSTGPSRSAPASWRPGKRAGVEPQPEYRWQQAAGPAERRAGFTRRRFRNLVWLILSAGLLALLIYFLLFAPRRSPLVAVTAVYSEPLPPNAWVQEDLEALRQLDKRTLSVYGGLDDWTSGERGMRLLDQHLRRISPRLRPSEPLLLYVNMHGAVDGAGNPCLIPPGAAAGKSETWLPVRQLLERLKDPALLKPQVNKLLLLDCTRLRVHWPLGILDNTFAARLAQVVQDAQVPNLVVLSASSPGEASWVSRELSGSVFGHHLSLGLAGEADGEQSGQTPDGRVSLHELHAYLTKSVGDWAQRHRGESQQPMLIPANAADFDLGMALSGRGLRRFGEQLERSRRSGDAQLEKDIDQLWRRHDDLLAAAPYRDEPQAWHQFQHRLLWLEQSAAAGAAYASSARSLLNQLKRFAAGDERPSSASRGSSPNVYSAALAESLGATDAATANRLREALTQLQEQPSAASLQAALTLWPTTGPAAHFAERHFLRMLQRYEDAQWWRQPAVIRRSLELRRRGDQLGAVSERDLFYWLRAHVQAGDAARQEGEDCLLAGDPQSAPARDAAWEEAEQHYRAADEIASLVGAAVRTRDQAYAELPYLAQWFFRPAATEPAGPQAENRKRVITLVEQVQQLSAELDRHGTTEGEAAFDQPGFRGLAEQVANELGRLRGLAVARGSQLEQAGDASVAAVRDLESLLPLAILPAPQRSRLRDRLAAFTQALETQAAAAVPSGAPAGETKQEDGGSEAPAVSPTTEHPAVRLLDLAGPSAPAAPQPAKPQPASAAKAAAPQDPWAAIEQQGERVRQALAGLAAQSQASLTERLAVAESGPTAAGTEHVPARTALSRAACRLRAAAPIGCPPLDPDPVATLRDFDLQQLLVWQARRALDDFWGPAAADEPAFFELAANGYLHAADQVMPRHATTQRQFDRLQGLLEIRRSAAQSGIALTATDLLLIKEDEPGIGSIDVRRQEGTAGEAIPTGRLGVWFRDQRGRIAASARTVQLAKLTSQAEKLSYDLDGKFLAGRGPQLQAVAMFRGHEFAKPSLLRLLGGVTVDFQPQEHAGATVTLYGARRKEASLIFILDCSNSMSTPITVEAPVEGLAQAVTTRMEVAKFALQLMLERLAQEEGKRVGVRFYGHRVGWNVEQPAEMLPQTEYARPIPSGLMPSEDVELVLPLGRFDTVAAGQVNRLLPSVKPWGETPLYLALVQAVRDFALDKPGTEKSIVVVTDGINNQFNPAPEAAKTRQDVLQERGHAPIRIHVVGFGIPETEQVEAVREFDALAAETDGSFHQATSVADLLGQLQALLGYGEYALLDAQEREIEKAGVDVPIPVPPPVQSEAYQVAWEQLREPLPLMGGEAAELEIDATGRQLLSLTYEVGAPVFRPLVAGTQATQTGVNFGAHQPIRREGQVSLPFSFQRADRHFTPRPAEVWIEVTPRSADQLRVFPGYAFYDADYAGKKRVPLLEWNVRDWPAAADRAEVRVFGKAKKTPPTATVALTAVADRTPPSGEGHLLEGVPGFNYQVRTRRDADGWPLRVRLLERHGADSAGVGSVKVEMVPVPQRILHQFDAENRMTLHTFYYGGENRQVPADAEIQIHFTTRQELETDAWQIEQPLSVPVAASRDLLEVVPPAVEGR